MSRRRKAPPDEPELTFSEWWVDLRQQPWREKLKTVGALLLVVPFLALVFLVAFLLFGATMHSGEVAGHSGKGPSRAFATT